MYDSTPDLFGDVTRKSHRRSPARTGDDRHVDNFTATWPPARGRLSHIAVCVTKGGGVGQLPARRRQSIDLWDVKQWI